MFGFSVTKLLVLAAIIAAVWYGFKWINRVNAVRDADRVSREAREKPAPAETQDMSRCEVCGTFVPEQGARHCGREGCPYPS